jgi:hypothetical protein
MKYRVKKGAALLYPDGTLRGQWGYIIDGDDPRERATVRMQADALERCRDRQTPASPFDPQRLAAPKQESGAAVAPDSEPAKAAKKKATKKKAVKKKATKKKAD